MTLTVWAHGRDLTRQDAEWKAILDAVHAAPSYAPPLPDSKFLVKRMWASAQWAYLCALIVEKDGTYESTDESLDVVKIILSKREEKWMPVAQMEDFTSSPMTINCKLHEENISDDVLRKVADEGKDR